jgi:endonuclease IV
MVRHVGLENVGAFHLNDSKKPLGSRVDRHQHIGEGELGLEPFRFLLNDPRFKRIPKVIETPKTVETESDLKNMRTLRSLLDADRSPSIKSARHGRPHSAPLLRHPHRLRERQDRRS